MTLTELKTANPEWFSRKNKKLFGDVTYRVLHSKVTGEPYLVRSTYAWTDMFNQPKRLHYRLNTIRADKTIGPLVDDFFTSYAEVKQWLKEN